MLFPNPWLVLVALAAAAGCVAAGEIHGRQTERKAWELVITKQQLTAAESLAKSEVARRETERAFHDLKDKVELEHAEQERHIEAAYTANRQLLAGHGGLYDAKGSGGGACRGSLVSANACASGGDPAPTSGCGLSAETSDALLTLARDADRAAAYAWTCHQWALSISHAGFGSAGE